MAAKTAVPNRIFVGGISSKTNEDDLKVLFSRYGCIKATKIILDEYGASRGYGFVTFETEEEAEKALNEKETITFNARKLNVAPAFKKHPYNRNVETTPVHASPVVWSANPYSGSLGFPAREPVYYPQASVPMIWQQQLYMPPSQAAPPGISPYFYAITPDFQYQSIGNTSDLSETSSSDSGEIQNGKMKSRASPALATEYERNRSMQMKTCHAQSASTPKYNSCIENPNTYTHSSPVPTVHVLAKTVNGVTVMAYPQYLMGSPTIVHMKDDSENLMSELGYMHSPIATGALTPPPTPLTPLSCDFSVNTSMESSRKS